MIKNVKVELGGRILEIETGKHAKQSESACTVRYGDTVCLVTCNSREIPPATGSFQGDDDFLKLTVDYREKAYAAGRIPGGFFKREGQPREKEILTCRLIDRSIRSLFPSGVKKDIQVLSTVLSADQNNDSDIPSIIGASVCLSLSRLPFRVPVFAVRIGKVDGEYVVNPTFEERDRASVEMVFSGTENAIIMIEGGAMEISEDEFIKVLGLAEEEIKKGIALIRELISQVAPEKDEFSVKQAEQALSDEIKGLYLSSVKEYVRTAMKKKREGLWDDIKKGAIEKYGDRQKEALDILHDMVYREARNSILYDSQRVDGRKPEEIRKITCDLSVLPRTHGSSCFTRGETQALVIVTLGTSKDMQIMDDLEGEYKKRFMVHYNFPGFATGEVKPVRGPSRREIGHGAMTERALKYVLPEQEEFPYSIRIVSEILESNGSSSMASVCGGSLAMMDAGVKIKAHVAGCAMGLIREGEKYRILTDIQGFEDHLGDMDFKVAGTRAGITSLQMDLKPPKDSSVFYGVTKEILKEGLTKARLAINTILDIMEKSITAPREKLSEYAPQMIKLEINPDKVRFVIGPGGKVIKKITEETGASIDIEDNGVITIASCDAKSLQKAKEMVQYYSAEVEVGKVYRGRVTKIVNFGAFVEVLPGKEGLLHVSQMALERVENVREHFKENDEVEVKVMEIDELGRVNLSRKVLLKKEEPPK